VKSTSTHWLTAFSFSIKRQNIYPQIFNNFISRQSDEVCLVFTAGSPMECVWCLQQAVRWIMSGVYSRQSDGVCLVFTAGSPMKYVWCLQQAVRWSMSGVYSRQSDEVCLVFKAGSPMKYVWCLHTTNQKPSCYYNEVSHNKVSGCFFPPLSYHIWQLILDHDAKFINLRWGFEQYNEPIS
jgi:hypothetical protein